MLQQSWASVLRFPPVPAERHVSDGGDAVTNWVLSGRVGDRLGAGRRTAMVTPCRFCPLLAPWPPEKRGFRKSLTGAELANTDARRQRLSPPGVKAGDRIRTDDVQLGKLAFYH